MNMSCKLRTPNIANAMKPVVALDQSVLSPEAFANMRDKYDDN